MLYFKFTINKNLAPRKKTFWEALALVVLKFLMPKANPTLEKNIDQVVTWYVEYDEYNQFVNREIGLDEENNIVFKAPFEDNLGFWCDNELSYDDFKNFHILNINKDEFLKLWNFKAMLR